MNKYFTATQSASGIIVLTEPPTKGHGASRRKSFLISYMQSNAISFVSLNQTVIRKSETRLPILKIILNSQIYQQFCTIKDVSNGLLNLLESMNTSKLFIRFLAFSEHEALYYFCLKAYIKFKARRANQLYENFKYSQINFQISTFSRGDIVSIYKVNNPPFGIVKRLIRPFIIFYYSCLQYIGLLVSEKYAVQMLFLKHILILRYRLPHNSVNVICNNLPEEKHTLTKQTRHKLERTCQWDHQNITIGLVAPMYKYCKGLDVFVDCCRLLEKEYSTSVVTAGSGPDELFIQEELKYLSVNYHHFGWLSDLREMLDQCDVLVLPSRYDSCPNLLLEAMTRNNPRILASNIPAHRELLQREDLLFDLALTDFPEKVNSLMSLSNSQYSSLLDNQRNRLDFDWSSIVIDWVKS